MLNFLTHRQFNPFDLLWIGMSALAIRDENYFAVFVLVVGGLLASVCLEMWAERSRKSRARS